MIDTVYTIALLFLILSVLVVIHELGHFIAARIFGVAVEEFGLGFPPRAAIIKKGKQTTYTLNWLPFGGFVKLKGEQGESQDSDSFAAQAVWKKIIILGAGVFMNLAFTVFVFTAGFTFGVPQSVEGISDVSSLRDFRIQVVNVQSQSPAEKAGLASGDIIKTISGQAFTTISDIRQYVTPREGMPLAVEVQRNGSTVSYTISPEKLGSNGSVGFGVGLVAIATISYPIHIAFWESVKTTGFLIKTIFVTLGNAFQKRAFDGFVGPVGIAQHAFDAAKLGITYLLNLMALISVSLAIFNVLPIPALDGGRILFAVIEKVRRRAIKPEIENTIHLVGFALLLLLLLLVTVRDVGNIIR